jgi:hypothetical protein
MNMQTFWRKAGPARWPGKRHLGSRDEDGRLVAVSMLKVEQAEQVA